MYLKFVAFSLEELITQSCILVARHKYMLSFLFAYF